jgi:hypothetical protein
VHLVLPKGVRGQDDARDPGDLVGSAVDALLPGSLARDLLSALDPSTAVAVDNKSHDVADRAAYDLVLTPRTDATKIGSIRIAVDGETKVPLGVEVYARGASSPSIDVAFTSIDFGRQADRNFRFDPPADASVRKVRPGAHQPTRPSPPGKVWTSGTGWATVIAARPGSRVWKELHALRRKLTPVHGWWGSGYLLDSDLFSALLTKNGRVFVGTVPPEALYAAAGQK